jgi:hypothetical protein
MALQGGVELAEGEELRVVEHPIALSIAYSSGDA